MKKNTLPQIENPEKNAVRSALDEILTGLGSIDIQQPRVRDRRKEKVFSSMILPRYNRKTEA